MHLLRRVFIISVLIVGGVFGHGLVATAQLTVSALRGTVTDESGGAVPGAAIVVRNVDTGFERRLETNEQGFYEVPDIQRGTYSVQVTASGFTTVNAEDIVITSSEIRRLDVKLTVGALADETTVVAGAAVITTEGARQRSTLSNRDYIEKPWVGNGINPLLLLTMSPLVQNTGGIFGVQVAGLPTRLIQSTVDGVGGDATLNGTNVHFYQEVNVVTGNNSAEFPRPAQISMVSRSGTNQFRGVVQYWNQDSALAARDFFAPTKPDSETHNMVVDVAGPLIKNRTFGLFVWEGQRIPASTFYLRDVPTQAMRTGDFSQLLNSAAPVQLRDPLTGAPFAGNIIPSSRFSPVASDVMDQYLPAPNLGAATALNRNYGFEFPYPTDLYHLDNYMGRVDHKISDSNTIFGRFQLARPLYVLNSSYENLFWTRVRRTYNMTVEDTHIFSPRFVNTARFGLYRPTFVDGETVDGRTPPRGDQIVADLGIQGLPAASQFSEAGFPTMNITGYSSITSPPGGYAQDYREWHMSDTFSASLGRHFLRMGGELRLASQFNGAVPEGTFGSFAFNGSITGHPFADFLLGMPFSSSRVTPITNRTQLDSELGLFVQDTFRVNQKLTLDLGLRWDRFGSPDYEDGLIYNWDAATGSVVVPNESLSLVSPLFPSTISVIAGNARQKPSNSNFVPRLGAAYLIRPTLVVRGGYGVFIETLGRFARAQGGGPYQIAETYQNLRAPYFQFPDPFPANGIATVPSQSVTGFPTQTSNGRIHQFNATVEKQIGTVGIRATYYGSRSRGLNYNIAINKPEASLTPFTASRRPWPQFLAVTYAREDGAANYDAFTIDVQRRGGSLSYGGHFTLANSMNKMLYLENPYGELKWNRDPETVRNRAVLNFTYQVPEVGRGWKNAVLGGWQLSWITYLESGQYFTPTFSGSDPSNTNTVGGVPNRVGNGNLPASERSVNRWFDASAFAVPQPGTFGDSGMSILEGPGLHLHNTSVNKNFNITDRIRFKFGVVAQNTFNHPNFSLPAANISVPGSVGVISSTRAFGGARQIMLRSRLEF